MNQADFDGSKAAARRLEWHAQIGSLLGMWGGRVWTVLKQ